ncbi:uncharacterized protein LTR77_003580 [Saxophila tyrrhenica]|uniref:Enoyl reductase (ER) domain-containing protein n=1 Tax=Saxophila tyrrhenica TaxID=1690608 RepID=A0AAV9PGM9_9PEZI|nr:hypothetical protein LTR77_003580 [Saxophila tyrrhenica]
MSATEENVSYSQWTLPEANGIDSLKLVQSAPIGPLGDNEVAVELHAASLNYRELVIAKNAFPPPWSSTMRPNLIPGSDGSGVVKAVGSNVSSFNPGDRVVTHMTPHLGPNSYPTFGDICAGLGHGADGTLRQYGHFEQAALVRAPESLSFEEAATLTCSGLTAWNALFGLEGRKVNSGDWALVQGTGGVSVAALQFAVTAGANVVATTSSEAKAARLKALGAKHVVNYKTTPEWGPAARELTPQGRGFDVVVDIGGDTTLGESLKAVRTEGLVVAAGMIGGSAESPVPMMAALTTVCIVRGILLGTKAQFEEMVQFIDKNDVRPVVDDKVFGLDEAKEAMRMLERQEHFSKIVIKLR